MIKKFGCLKENLIRIYTKQILEGLEYLHVNEVVHRDIKGANVLIEKNGTAKLSDFGSSKRIITSANDCEKQPTTIAGTPNWMAPEVIKQQYFGRFSDIWSLGCTIIEMATGKPPYYQYTNPIMAMINIARDATPPQFPDCSTQLYDFLENCFRKDPLERLNVFKLLNHSFITGIQQLKKSVSGSGEESKSKEKKINNNSGGKAVYFNNEDDDDNQLKNFQKKSRFVQINEEKKAQNNWMQEQQLFNFSITPQEQKKLPLKLNKIIQAPEYQEQKNNQSTYESTNQLQLYDSQINFKNDYKQSANWKNMKISNNMLKSKEILQSKEKQMFNNNNKKGKIIKESNSSLSKYNDLQLLEFIEEDQNSFIEDTQNQCTTPQILQQSQHHTKFPEKQNKNFEFVDQTLELVLESFDQGLQNQ